MEILYRQKAFHTGKKIRKNDFAPQKSFPVTPVVPVPALLIVNMRTTQATATPACQRQLSPATQALL